MASAAARLCFLAGFRVAVLERAEPLAVRRPVCYASAVLSGACEVEGCRGQLVEVHQLEDLLARRAALPVLVDAEGRTVRLLRPEVLVDARMAKQAADTTPRQAPVVIGVGPGFEAGRHVHAVVETQRGPALGAVIWTGEAQRDTSVPAAVLGVTEDRVLRAPREGRFASRVQIGELVEAGQPVGEVEGEPVNARVAGMVRGLVADGVTVARGIKVGDIDPRGAQVDPARISDKARAVAAGVLEAVLLGLAGRKSCRDGTLRLSS